MITLIFGKKFWHISNKPPIKPPLFKKMPWRPRSLRRKEEYKSGSGVRLVRKGKEITC